jgi:hypothetical protein
MWRIANGNRIMEMERIAMKEREMMQATNRRRRKRKNARRIFISMRSYWMAEATLTIGSNLRIRVVMEELT